MTKKVSRRTFLQMTTMGSAALLAACQAPLVVQTGAAGPAEPGTEERLVRVLMPSWATAELPFDMTAREFSEATPGVTVQIQTTFEGWDTKVQAQIAEGEVEWSGAGIASSASSSLPLWIFTELIQDMAPYIESSQQEGADLLLSDMISTIRDASTYEGGFWGIPYSFENISFNWRTDYFAEVGASEAPATWEEWLEIARALKEWGEDEEIYPTSFIPDLDASTGTLIYGSLEDPFNEDLVLRWDSEEAVEALAFYQQMVQEGLTPPHGYDGYLDAYLAGKVASLQAQSSRGVWGQLAFGTESVQTSRVPVNSNGMSAGTPFWGNCTCLLNNAPYPQELVDYLIYTMGPQNESFQRTVISTGKTPVYNSIYENMILGDPRFGIYQWMIPMREQVEQSVARPFNNYFSIQDTVYRKYIVILTEPDSTMTPAECAQAILAESMEEIQKQQL